MELMRKQEIALKFLIIKVPGSHWDKKLDQPETKKGLSQVAIASDLPIDEIISFIDQIVGKKEVTLQKDKQREVALLIVKVSFCLMTQESGMFGLSDDAEDLAEEIDISATEFRTFLKEIFREQLEELFPT